MPYQFPMKQLREMKSSAITMNITRLRDHLSNRMSTFTRLANWWYRYDLLDKLSCYGIIAGGAIVYSMNPWIATPPSDIDIFLLVPNGEGASYGQIAGLIAKQIGSCFKIESMRTYGALLEIRAGGQTWQIIATQYTSVGELLLNFDMDYVRCAYYQGQLVVTPEAQRACETRTVSMVSRRIRSYRLQKARAKGFRCDPSLDLVANPEIPSTKIYTGIDPKTVAEWAPNPLMILEYDFLYETTDWRMLPSLEGATIEPVYHKAYRQRNGNVDATYYVIHTLITVPDARNTQNNTKNKPKTYTIPHTLCRVCPIEPLPEPCWCGGSSGSGGDGRHTSEPHHVWRCLLAETEIVKGIRDLRLPETPNQPVKYGMHQAHDGDEEHESRGVSSIFLELPDTVSTDWQWMQLYWVYFPLTSTVRPHVVDMNKFQYTVNFPPPNELAR